MRIGLQAPRKDSSLGGGATFERELFDGLLAAQTSHSHTLVVFSRYGKPASLGNVDRVEWITTGSIGLANLSANFRRIINHVFNVIFRWPSFFRSEHWLDAHLRRHQVEFFVNLVPEAAPSEVPYLAFIWDVLHRGLPYFPECSQRGAWVRREIQVGDLARRAAFLCVGTEVGRQELNQYYQVPTDRVYVFPYPTPRFALDHPVDGTGSGLPQVPSGEYIFYPASFHAHKNHVTVLYALARLRDEHHVVINAVFSGGDWGNGDHIRKVVSQLGLDAQVHFVGFVSREALIVYYRNALCLVFASLLGPDNIPPLEAFALGCPALVAEIPGAQEQMEGAALLFPPTDDSALVSCLLELRRDPQLRRKLVEAGKTRAGKFTSIGLGHSVIGLIERFAPIRRCWSAARPYRVRYNITRLFGK